MLIGRQQRSVEASEEQRNFSGKKHLASKSLPPGSLRVGCRKREQGGQTFASAWRHIHSEKDVDLPLPYEKL
jgi:hypothetical protein